MRCGLAPLVPLVTVRAMPARMREPVSPAPPDERCAPSPRRPAAIDFYCTVGKTVGKQGEQRVVITFNGKVRRRERGGPGGAAAQVPVSPCCGWAAASQHLALLLLLPCDAHPTHITPTALPPSTHPVPSPHRAAGRGQHGGGGNGPAEAVAEGGGGLQALRLPGTSAPCPPPDPGWAVGHLHGMHVGGSIKQGLCSLFVHLTTSRFLSRAIGAWTTKCAGRAGRAGQAASPACAAV